MFMRRLLPEQIPWYCWNVCVIEHCNCKPIYLIKIVIICEVNIQKKKKQHNFIV